MPLLPVVLMLPRGPRQGSPPPSRTTQQNEEHNRTSRPDGAGVLPMLLANRERKPTRKEGRGKKGGDKPTSPQRKGYPPLLQWAGSRSPHHKFAPKNQQKVALGSFEKIFEKNFRGNVSGVRKTPCVVSTEGVLTNENREISNLGNANNQKRTKALLNNQGQR